MDVLPDASEGQFPRGSDLPKQSPMYWVREKDRYLRQLLIQDIQHQTKRDLVVYFTTMGYGQIDARDADDISEALADCKSRDIDLLIQTPGGFVDACEKLISVLKQRTDDYRVIVPSWAKSAGTIIALSGSTIVMGVNSELGPIDPQFNGIPAEFIRDDPAQPFAMTKLAGAAITRTQNLARQVLNDRMMKGADAARIDDLVNQLSSAQSYCSHGAVINAREAENLGLAVTYLAPEDDLWRRVWLLYCMYEHDSQVRNYAKVFEGPRISIARHMPPPPT
jgi:membrane-bound ClpP family serine protease